MYVTVKLSHVPVISRIFWRNGNTQREYSLSFSPRWALSLSGSTIPYYVENVAKHFIRVSRRCDNRKCYIHRAAFSSSGHIVSFAFFARNKFLRSVCSARTHGADGQRTRNGITRKRCVKNAWRTHAGMRETAFAKVSFRDVFEKVTFPSQTLKKTGAYRVIPYESRDDVYFTQTPTLLRRGKKII